jgi:xanthine dehydrogenase large subunit
MGGAFGGKESQAAAFAAYVALVAHKLGRSARLCITQDEDMKITGKRHPFHNFYEVGFDQSGKILALKAKLYADGGAYTDLSPSILDRALFHIDGAYNIPHAHIEGFVCKTNHHSNTAFRGFGGPQGMLTIENIMEDIAKYLNKDAMEIRKANCYKVGDTTPYGQSIDEPNLEKLFSTFPESADYFKRRIDVESFNKSNLSKVRGLSCTAMKFGIAFTAKHLNQGNALVHVLTDGSVQVSTGATEMGQGVYIKVQQTVAECLGISVDRVKVMATSTDKNANTSPTAASSGSDINCAAAKNACDKIRRRLAYLANLYFENKISDPMVDLPEASQDFQSDILSFSNDVIENKASGKNISFTELVQKAYLHRIYLSEHAHYKTEGIGFDKSTQKGTPFKYFTNGISVSEVEVDKYTGEMKVLRADVMMDLGRSVNPAIDHGQVAGAFIQGMGWLTSENLFYSAAGELLSHSPTTYKVPNIQDTPRIFNISFLENTSNEKNVFGTKAVGEPPLLLANSVWTAVKDAIHNGRMQSGRVQSGKNDLVKISTPAIPEVILMELEREI